MVITHGTNNKASALNKLETGMNARIIQSLIAVITLIVPNFMTAHGTHRSKSADTGNYETEMADDKKAVRLASTLT